MKFSVLSLAIFAGLFVNCIESYKILGVFPTWAKSHYIVGSALMRGLAEKGHDVTVISPFPLKKPLKNWRDIPTTTILDVTKDMMNNILTNQPQSPLELFLRLFNMGEMLSNVTLQEESIQTLLKSGEQFDVVINEVFLSESFLGFADHFQAPVIGLSTFGASMWTCEMVGSPSPPSYVPNPFLGFTDKMTFLQRLGNLAMVAIERVSYDYLHMPKQNALYKKYFPGARKSLQEMIRNVSLVLLNNHVSVSYPRPYSVNMIEVGGMHIDRRTNPLPADMKEFLDSAKDGAIYFSMGSNIKGKTLGKDKLEAILKVFSSLKQKVLWKWEDPTLPGKPSNAFINAWFPQNDILSHPNVKLFITHGGLLSTTEAVFFGVPIVAIPIFGDQHLNAARAEKSGMGRKLNYETLTEDSFRDTIMEVLSKQTMYAENVKTMSKRYRDQPQPPIDTAVYWVEYVARHKGAWHLHSAGQDLNFIQYHNLDIYALILGVLILFVSLVKKLVCCMCSSKKGSAAKMKTQ